MIITCKSRARSVSKLKAAYSRKSDDVDQNVFINAPVRITSHWNFQFGKNDFNIFLNDRIYKSLDCRGKEYRQS